MYHKPTRVRFGAAYYHEYQRVDRLKTDLDLMAEASFSVIRVGESAGPRGSLRTGRSISSGCCRCSTARMSVVLA